jgi:hypothetical protein
MDDDIELKNLGPEQVSTRLETSGIEAADYISVDVEHPWLFYILAFFGLAAPVRGKRMVTLAMRLWIAACLACMLAYHAIPDSAGCTKGLYFPRLQQLRNATATTTNCSHTNNIFEAGRLLNDTANSSSTVLKLTECESKKKDGLVFIFHFISLITTVAYVTLSSFFGPLWPGQGRTGGIFSFKLSRAKLVDAGTGVPSAVIASLLTKFTAFTWAFAIVHLAGAIGLGVMYGERKGICQALTITGIATYFFTGSSMFIGLCLYLFIGYLHVLSVKLIGEQVGARKSSTIADAIARPASTYDDVKAIRILSMCRRVSLEVRDTAFYFLVPVTYAAVLLILLTAACIVVLIKDGLAAHNPDPNIIYLLSVSFSALLLVLCGPALITREFERVISRASELNVTPQTWSSFKSFLDVLSIYAKGYEVVGVVVDTALLKKIASGVVSLVSIAYAAGDKER